MRYNFFLSIILTLTVSSQSLQAKVVTLDMELEAIISSPRWMYNTKDLPQKPLALKLMRMKKAQLDKKWESCFLLGEGLKKQAPQVRHWIEASQMQCLLVWGGVSRKARGYLASVLASVETSPKWGSALQRRILWPLFYEGHLLILKFETTSARASAWKRIEKLQRYQSELSREQQAQLYFRVGELAFIEQKLSAAHDFFKRSRKLQDRPEISEKLAIIGKTVPSLAESSTGMVSNADPLLRFSEDELQILARMKRALDSKDLVSAVEDGTELIQKYPGSENATWAEDQILSVYLGVVDQSDERLQLYRQKIVQFMKVADASRLQRWARNAWARGAYMDSVHLSGMALEKLGSHPEERKILLMAANSAISSGQYSVAEEVLKKLSLQHGGSKESLEAHFRLGLLYYRLKKYSQGASHFEKLLAVQDDSDFHSSSMYWRWRCYQQLKREDAAQAAVELVQKYPINYYGLRAALEMGGNKIHWLEVKSEKAGEISQPGYLPLGPVKAALNFTGEESDAFERYQLLASAGWFEEAQVELEQLPDPVTPEQKIIYAKWHAETLNHGKSITLLNEVWTEKPQLRNRNVVRLAFPQEFSREIELYSDKYKLSPNLVRALIRQESSFRPRALSASNAHGLMQIVPVTARDIAQNLGWKKSLILPEDLFQVEQNIQFGTSYFARLLRAFNGHVPLALAAYNAGIGRVRKWMNARSDLGIDEKKLDSSPDSEIWIDELPWDETRHYVKSILRNYLLYRAMEENTVVVENPIWKNIEKSTTKPASL